MKAKRAIIALLTILLVASCFSACGSAEETTKKLTNKATYEDFTLVLHSAEVATDENGKQVLRVNATYTNKSEKPYYALESFAVRAFQHDKEITDVSTVDESVTQEVKNGQSIDVLYTFELKDSSKVEVLIGEPTSDETTIGKASYNLNN